MLGLKYDSEAARATAVRAMRLIRDSAYSASIELAAERGAFPAFDAERYCAAPFIQRLPPAIQANIQRYGIRNSHLLAIAPAGAISLLAENVSSGIEPVFGLTTFRRVREADGNYRNFEVTDYAFALWRSLHGRDVPKPDYLMDAEAIAPRDQLLMQAALAPLVDGSISKTISLPHNFAKDGVEDIYETAYLLGLKGCTVFCSGTRAGSIARASATGALDAASEYCCTIGRQTD
jgi:ribonucleoside-diphosphate reductase alpha chain